VGSRFALILVRAMIATMGISFNLSEGKEGRRADSTPEGDLRRCHRWQRSRATVPLLRLSTTRRPVRDSGVGTAGAGGVGMLHKHEWVQAEGTIVQVFLRPGHAEADKFGSPGTHVGARRE
jgi:hypothetical protein